MLTVTLETFDKYPDPNKRPQWPGERAIVVDGVRWGHTIAKSHGRRGTSYRFKQDEGEVLLRDEKASFKSELRNSYELSVSKPRVSKYGPQGPKIEELVLAKAIELVEIGCLRDPAIVLAERNAYKSEAGKRRIARIAAEAKEFRDRAKAVFNGQLGVLVDQEAIVDRIVEAMRWAQTQ